MYPTQFEYQRPTSVQEAVAILAGNPDAKVLAGGHSLIPAMKLRLAMPGALVDIGRIDGLRGINVNGGSATIGAMTTYVEIEDSAELAKAFRSLPRRSASSAIRRFGHAARSAARWRTRIRLPTSPPSCWRSARQSR